MLMLSSGAAQAMWIRKWNLQRPAIKVTRLYKAFRRMCKLAMIVPVVNRKYTCRAMCWICVRKGERIDSSGLLGQTILNKRYTMMALECFGPRILRILNPHHFILRPFSLIVLSLTCADSELTFLMFYSQLRLFPSFDVPCFAVTFIVNTMLHAQ